MSLSRAAFAVIIFCAAFHARAAGDASIVGLWQRDSGSSRVRIAPCADALCGTIMWVRDAESPTKVGMRVFYALEPERANNWTCKAFNPEDKENYSGTVTLQGDRMTTTGCVIGRLFCKSVHWERVK